MAKRSITHEMYQALVDGFRQQPGNATYAARTAGVDRRTAKRGWEQGWQKQYVWAQPIREVIREEMANARKARLEAQEAERFDQEKEREKARTAAIKAAQEEAQAVSIARTNSIGAGMIVGSLMRALVPLTKQIETALANPATQLAPNQIAKMLADMANVTRHSNEAMRTALELERLRLGEPTNIGGIQGQLDDLTTEEAVEELLAVQRALNRAARSGLMPEKTTVDAQGNIVIDLPEEAFEEADVIPIRRA